MNKIKKYPKGFKFTLQWHQIPKAKANALRIIIQDATEQGLLEQIATELSLELEVTAETFRKL
jgi:hypothetical protein